MKPDSAATWWYTLKTYYVRYSCFTSICDIFTDYRPLESAFGWGFTTLSLSVYPEHGMIDEWLVRKDLKGSGQNLIEVLSQHFLRRDWESNVTPQWEIRTGDLPDTVLELVPIDDLLVVLTASSSSVMLKALCCCTDHRIRNDWELLL
jgi:hypothetical protein